MTYFDRWDICAAYNLYSVLWGGDGCAYENRIQCRLSRIKYRPGPSDQAFETMSENAREIYNDLVRKHQGADVECTTCGEAYRSGDGHPRVAMCYTCWKG